MKELANSVKELGQKYKSSQMFLAKLFLEIKQAFNKYALMYYFKHV